MAAGDERYGVVLNVQRGTAERFECHIDSNPLTGLLFCTNHAAAVSWFSPMIRTPPASTPWSATARLSARRRGTSSSLTPGAIRITRAR